MNRYQFYKKFNSFNINLLSKINHAHKVYSVLLNEAQKDQCYKNGRSIPILFETTFVLHRNIILKPKLFVNIKRMFK